MMWKVMRQNDGGISVVPDSSAEAVRDYVEYTRPGPRGSVRTIVESRSGPGHQWCETEREAYVAGARMLLARYRASITAAREALNKYTDWLAAHGIDADDLRDEDTGGV